MSRSTILARSPARRPAHSSSWIRWGGAAIAAALLAAPDARAGDPPNLVAKTISGPGQVEVDSKVLATVRIENLGGALAGDYTAHVVLSQDLTIDLNDPIVATIEDDFI
ncbi:MAG: hypothetical protein ACF8XB_08800, partial [Planctomycetota bacterium JB042]